MSSYIPFVFKSIVMFLVTKYHKKQLKITHRLCHETMTHKTLGNIIM